MLLLVHRPALLAGLLSVLILGGCSLVRPTMQPAGVASPAGLKSWTLAGRIGVKTAEEGWSANLIWEHEVKQDRLRISGPFSQGMVSIVIQDDLIHINEGNGVEMTSREPDLALKERLGFAVPLQSLRYWVMGVPDPHAAHRDDPEQGVQRRFSQLGWSLAYEKFSRVGPLLLPQKATIQGHDVRLKLIADEWTIKE